MRIQYFHLQPHSHLANFMIAQHSAHPIPIPKANQQPPQKNTDWAIFGRFQRTKPFRFRNRSKVQRHGHFGLSWRLERKPVSRAIE